MDTIQVLLGTYRENASHLDHVHLSASWTSLGRLVGQPAERFWQQKSVGALTPLVHHTVQATNAGELGAR